MDKQQVLTILKDRGYKFTPQRREIIEKLVKGGEPLSVKELLEQLRDKFPELSPDTVYRTLKVLCNLGIVCTIGHQGKKTTRYKISVGLHHHHLVCISCGRSFCMAYCPMEGIARTLAQQANFKVVEHAFEILGYCSDCRVN